MIQFYFFFIYQFLNILSDGRKLMCSMCLHIHTRSIHTFSKLTNGNVFQFNLTQN
jgi:hypothetical protein